LLFGFGWGNPTPTAALHYRNRQQGVVITYVTPVLVNLLLGIGAVVGVSILLSVHYGQVNYVMFFRSIHIATWTSDPYYIAILVLSHFALVNINIALFNLLPVYPLAANRLILLFSRPDTIARVNHYEKPMQIAMIVMLAFNIIAMILNPLVRIIIRMAWGLAI